MSFKDILHLIMPLITGSDSDVAEKIITDLHELTTSTNGHDIEKSKSANTERRSKRRKVNNIRKTSVSTIEVCDWYCVAECAAILGRDESDIQHLIENGHVQTITWSSRWPCVHRRQVAAWLDGKQYEVETEDVYLNWTTISGIAKSLDVSSGLVHGRIEKGEIAVHDAGRWCRLVNIAECEKYFGS